MDLLPAKWDEYVGGGGGKRGRTRKCQTGAGAEKKDEQKKNVS